MGVAMVTGADTRVSAGDTPAASAAAPVQVELVAATVEPGLAVVVAAMARGITHPGSRRDITAATAAMGKRALCTAKPRLDGRFMVLARDRKVEPLPSSLLGRQSILVATTSHEINPLLALRANPASSNGLAQLQRVQPGPTGLGRDRMRPTGNDSTLKQQKDCVTGKAERLDTPTQNVITRNTGVIVITTTMTGGVTIATLSFLLVEGFGAGMTAGGIRPGDMIRIIHTTITMVPIYGYDGLQPDEVIANVQAVLQQLGYYPYEVDGVLGPLTETAIANYQRDYGLSVTGAIDQPTVRSLGLGT